jgi:hypothetical protein
MYLNRRSLLFYASSSRTLSNPVQRNCHQFPNSKFIPIQIPSCSLLLSVPSPTSPAASCPSPPPFPPGFSSLSSPFSFRSSPAFYSAISAPTIWLSRSSTPTQYFHAQFNLFVGGELFASYSHVIKTTLMVPFSKFSFI